VFFFFWPFPLFFIIFLILVTFRIIPRILKVFFYELTQSRLKDIPGRQAETSFTGNSKLKPNSQEYKERQIFHVAKSLKGRLTLSDIVMETDMGMQEAEKAIQRMIDEVHVRMIVKDNGLIIYEFPEIMARFQEGKDFYKDI
jgi:hypothetical protein